MIADFFESALIVDDRKEEVSGLINILESKGIATTFFEYITNNSTNNSIIYKNRKIIFMDLYIDGNDKITGNLSRIRKFLQEHIGSNFGAYGIILWTKHTEDLNKFIEKINTDKKDNPYTPPLFICTLDKTKYNNNNYENLFEDIENKLKENPAATFFLEWSNSVDKGFNKTIHSIFNLIPCYDNKDFILSLLKKLALGYTGLNEELAENYSLHIDAYKAFDDILHAEMLNSHSDSSDIFSINKDYKVEDLQEACSHINTLLLIDTNNLDQRVIIPGNIYEITEKENRFICGNSCELVKKNKENKEKCINTCQNIVIEITPPCDFTNTGKKVKSRLVGGFICTINSEKVLEKRKNIGCNADYFYKEFWPVLIEDNAKIIIFDFRYFGDENDENLKDNDKYRLILRVKPKLFADILQKFSSHSARLGLSVMRPK